MLNLNPSNKYFEFFISTYSVVKCQWCVVKTVVNTWFNRASEWILLFIFSAVLALMAMTYFENKDLDSQNHDYFAIVLKEEFACFDVISFKHYVGLKFYISCQGCYDRM